MSLSNLPREILLDITDHLGDKATNALARTNHQVYDLLNPYLYRRDVTKPKSRSLTWAANIPDLYDDAVTNGLARTDLQGSNLSNQYLYRQLDFTRPHSKSLNWVIRNGVEGTIRLALDAGRYSNPISESFHVALQLVVQKRCLHFVKMLLSVDGIDPNYGGGSALISATKLGQGGIIQSLLAAVNINPNVRDQDHKTPLHLACERGYEDIVELFLARDDVDLNAGSDRFGTPLIAASYNNRVKIINLLLAKDGIDVNFIHKGKNTAISIAVGMGSTPVVKSLLASDNLDLNIVQQALVNSANLGDINITKLLLNYPKIDPNSAADNNGFTALMWAIRHCQAPLRPGRYRC
jgi:ankyrin repeat protein